ncbi:MAG: hypothetical protein A2Y93_07880 [Chloroflexi bacterium RBG_13_68_17]|nr:MAG: hypothetical protein A2Y93_07880 [Chloroflexi bacterium RBG_13_68_17]
MPVNLDADVALLHIAGGEARVTAPPGTLALTPPRRAGRGRAEDLLFLTLNLVGPRPVSPGLVDHLAQLAADSFYGTPGSVTAALRQAAEEINDNLLDANQDPHEPRQLQGRLLAGVLRGHNLFLAQCGVGQAILVRPGQVTRLTSEEAAGRPLGQTATPFVRYHHLEAQPGDLVILTGAPPPGWSDPTLSALSGLEPARALDRLVAASSADLTGLLLRVTEPGMAAAPVSTPSSGGRPAAREAASGRAESVRPGRATVAGLRQAPARPVRRQAARPAPRPAQPSRLAALRRRLEPVAARARSLLAALGQRLLNLLTRLAPGLSEPPRLGSFRPGALVATAVAVPLVVVAIASVVYFRQGRGEQFQEYLAQAQAAIVAAQLKTDPLEAHADWQAALGWIDLAESYRRTDDSQALRQIAQEALDSADLVFRLPYRPAVSGGFGGNARLTAMAATTTDLYVYDAQRERIWRAWSTGRGYEIDRDFDCLNGAGSVPGMGEPVDLVALNEPGVLGVAGVVAVDADGTLVYCGPDTPKAYSELTPPATGLGRIQAIEVFSDRLYVLDPEANSVWIYDASGGLFTGNAGIYFVEETPDLRQAIDLALAQDQLLLLFSDGHMESCRRAVESDINGGTRISVDCESDLRFQDERQGFEASDHILGATPLEMVYSPPPEPSLYFLDSASGEVYLYSMRLVYQGRFLPAEPFEAIPSAIAIGPPSELFVAVEDQVYYAQPLR